MNKFALVFYLILIVNFSQEEEINVNYENIYDLLINLLKGMSITNENLCANSFVRNRSKITKIIQMVIEGLKSGKEVVNVLSVCVTQLLQINNFFSDCRFKTLIQELRNIFTFEGIKGIADRMSKNVGTLYEYVQKIKITKGLADKLVYVGKCLQIILNIYVN